MNYRDVLINYVPQSQQEEQAKTYMQTQLTHYGDWWLYRDCPEGHLTVGALVVNPQVDQVLFIYHNIRQTWSWPGGHVDGNPDPLQVAIKEVQEETGLDQMTPVSMMPLSIHVCQVSQHQRHGQTVPAHCHSIFAYAFQAQPDQPLVLNSEETRALAWMPLNDIYSSKFSQADSQLYSQLIERIISIL